MIRPRTDRHAARRRGPIALRPEVAALEQRLLMAADQSVLSLSASAAYVAPGKPLTLTATVTDATRPGSLVPGGSVTFYDNGTALGTATFGSYAGATVQAQVATTGLFAGSHAFSAVYSGAGSLGGSSYGLTPVGSLQVVAGVSGQNGSTGNGGPATQAQVGNPRGVAVDRLGDVFIADTRNNVVREVTPDGNIRTIAGVAGAYDASGDGGPATAAHIGVPTGLAVAPDGTVYVADLQNNLVRALSPVGDGTYTIRTVAGTNGQGGPTTDGHLGTSNLLAGPQGLTLDASGNLYIANSSVGQVVELAKSNGYLYVVAGNGNGITTTAGLASGDGGSAHSSQNGTPYGVALDPAGNLYFSDPNSGVVREVTADGIIHTVAGLVGKNGATGDGGAATAAQVGNPTALAFDAAGNLYIGNNNFGTVRKVTPQGLISTVAVTPPAGSTSASLGDQYGLAFDAAGSLYVPDYSRGVVRKVGNSNVRTFVGNPYLTATVSTASLTAGGSETVTITAYHPDGTVDTSNADTVAVTSTDPQAAAGTVALKNGQATYQVKLTTAGTQTITVADAANATTATTAAIAVSPAALDHYRVAHVTPLAGDRLGVPLAYTITAQDAYGNTVAADNETLQVVPGDPYTTASSATLTLVAGQASLAVTSQSPAGVSTYSGSFAIRGARSATASYAQAADQTQTSLTTSDPTATPLTLTARVANISLASAVPDGGTVTFYDGSTMLGTATLSQGTAAFTATGLANGVHTFSAAYGGSGRFGASSYGSTAPGNISTVAGGGTSAADNIPATQASLSGPDQSAFDAAGNFYFVDYVNRVVRQISPDGTIRTVAGIAGTSGVPTEGAAANKTPLGQPAGVAVDAAGNLYVADRVNHVVYRVAADGTIRTYAGMAGSYGSGGDGGRATAATLDAPSGLAVDAAGNLYIADLGARVVRKVSPAGIISTVAGVADANLNGSFAGTPHPTNGDGGPAIRAQIGSPVCVAVDAAGNLYISEYLEGTIRKVAPSGIISTVAGVANQTGSTGDGGPATQAQIGYPFQLAVDSAGNLYLEDGLNSTVRKVSPAGIISTVAGIANAQGATGDGGPATQARLGFLHGLALDAAGDLFISTTTGAASPSNRVREVGGGLRVSVGLPLLKLTGLATSIAAGGSATFTVTAYQADGVTPDAGNNDFITITSTDTTVSGGVQVQLVNGTAQVRVVLRTAGPQSLTVTDPSQPNLTVTSPAVTVVPGAVASLQVAANSPAGGNRAGVALTYTVKALDAYGNVATADNEAYAVSSTDPNATVAAGGGTLANGLATFTVTPHLAGAQTLTVAAGTSGLQVAAPLAVLPGLARQLVLTGLPATIVAGVGVPVTVTAQDQYGNLATDDDSSITLSTGNPALAPVAATLVNGTATVLATFTAAGPATLSAASADGTEVGTSGAVTVTPAAATHLVVTTAATPGDVAGTQFGVTITAVDAYGNTDASQSGTINLASSDAQAVLPTGIALANGVATFNATLKTAGSPTLTATDPGGVLGAGSTSVAVAPAAATNLTVAGPATIPIGQPATYTVTATDAFGNVATGNNDALTFSGGGGATLPSGLSLLGGVATFSVTFATPGAATLTVGTATLSARATTMATTTVQGTVFLDLAGTGTPAAGDPGLAGRVVFLDLNGDGTLDAGEPTATTDGGGHYAFAGVAVANPPVLEATSLDGTDRYVASQARTAGDGSVNIGVTVLSPLAPLPAAAGLLPATPSTDATTAYIQALYRSVLGRNGSDAEVGTWLAYVKANDVSRADIAAMFVNSDEHRTDEVARYYQQFFGRTPDPAAIAWVNALKAGVSESRVVEALLDSAEYQQAHPTTSSLATALYNDVLGRAADAPAVAAFASAATPAPDMVAAFVDSVEAHDQVVESFYAAFLHRQKEAGASSASWNSQLDSGVASISGVAIGILASDEFLQDALAGRS